MGSLGFTAASRMELGGKLEKGWNSVYWKESWWGMTLPVLTSCLGPRAHG